MSRATPRTTARHEQPLDGVAEHVPGEHGRARDGHRAEPGDDAFGHVLGDPDGGAGGDAGDADEQDARHDVGEVVPVAPPGRRRAGRRRGCRRRRRRTAAGTRRGCR